MIDPLTFGLNVSRETSADLSQFHDLVLKWSSAINLISKSSVKTLWERHIWDSAQIIEYAGDGENWLDIGSGGGFPGVIIAVFAKHEMPQRHVTMVESDTRKATFLRAAVRELNLKADVVTARVEECTAFNADVLSARALSELSGLLPYAEQHLSTSGKALFPKGETWETELDIARQSWSFDVKAHKSKTNAAAAILEMKDIQRV